MKKHLKPIILIIIAALLLLGGVWFFLHSQSKEEEKPKQLSADEILAMSVETEPITTNLISGGFVQLSFKIQADSEKAKEELAKRDFQVRNLILRLASGMTDEQVKSPDGMANLEKHMKDEIDKLLQEGSVVQIYTTNKMIQ